jgi:penicillin-binding protein 1A
MKPQFISKLKIKWCIIYEPIPESHDVLNKDIAYAVIKLLEGVTEGGSGDRLQPLVVVMATTAGRISLFI